MPKIIICPDSFKGSLSATEAADLIANACLKAIPDSEVIKIPIADGGEGTVETLGATKIACKVNDAFFKPVDSFWGELGDTAVIELAACAGLPQAVSPNPEIASTFGVGELILDALNSGKRKIIIALGGSSTNDMGCGLASALGVRFLDAEGKEFIPAGGTLSKIAKIDMKAVDPRISESTFITMCDVTNPLYGEKGAAFVFAPQKGADSEMVLRLDAGLRHAGTIVQRDLGLDLASVPGTGAAGGCGAGVMAFLGSKLQSGIDVVLNLKYFDRELSGADLVITGEGKFDSQSIDGKAISGIAARAKIAKVPMVVLAGAAAETPSCYEMGVTAVFSIQRSALPLEEALKVSGESLYKTALNVMKFAFYNR